MRLFVGAELPADVRARLAAVELGEGWRAVPEASLHVTLAFLGELEDPAPVVDALSGVTGRACPARLGDVVLLPPRRPRVCAVRVDSPELAELQGRVSRALAAAGLYEPERRPFLAHVTIGRARGRAAAPRTPAPEAFSIGSYALFQSAPKSRYTALLRSTLPA